MPEVIHASYDKKGYKFTPKVVNADLEDVFVLENLLESGFENYDGKTSLDESHMMAVLECLSQLHGTGMAYKLFSTSNEEPESQSCINAEENDKEFEILRQRNVERKRMSKLKEEFPSLEEQIQLGGRKIFILVILLIPTISSFLCINLNISDFPSLF